jgi:hypothetical protein
MRCERTLLAPGRVQREAVGLVDDHAALSLAAVTVRSSGFERPGTARAN